MIMKKEKLKGYESPTTDVLELKVEGLVCVSPSPIIINAWEEDGVTIDF